MTTMHALPGDLERRRKRGRLQALLILSVAAIPVIAGTLAFYVWPPSGRVNYGELVDPRPVKLTGTDVEGSPFELSATEGKWRLVVFDSGQCPEACQRKLFFVRQARLAQGANQERIERIWIVDDAAPVAMKELGPLIEGAHVARVGSQDPERTFGEAGSLRAHIFLVDPVGHLMMRFPGQPDGRRMIKDLQRLLKYSRIG